MILLTPEEIQEAQWQAHIKLLARDVSVAKAQARKIIEWGEEACPHWGGDSMYKRQCSQCWQAFKAEV